MADLYSEKELKPEVLTVLKDVFHICDIEKTGSVTVSKLIMYLKEKATGTEVLDFLNDLRSILDPGGIDPSINWEKCILGMQQWINNVNIQCLDGNKNVSKSATKFIVLKEKEVSPNNLEIPKDSLAMRRIRYSTGSTYSNDSGETELSWDNSDIHIRIEELEITNKRLTEDNAKLKKHLEITEEQNTSIIQENDALKLQNGRYEKLLDESKVTLKSYDELKTTVLEYDNLKSELRSKISQLEKENTSLQAAVSQFENKISQQDVSIEFLKDERDKLADDLHLQKNLLNQIEDLKTSHDDVVEESVNKSEYMASVIAELSLANEVLKAQKSNIENELSDLKQEVCRYTVLNGYPTVTNTPLLSSTKIEHWPPSLHQELKAELDVSLDTFASPVRRQVNFADENDSMSDLSTYSEKYSSLAKQCKKKLKEKKEVVFHKIEEIVNQSNDYLTEKHDVSLIVEDLNQELESFTEKIAEFAQGKQIAEKRTLKLASAVKRLKDENLLLQEARDKALLKFGDLSISSLETEEKLKELTEILEEKIKLVEKLENEINTLKEKHEAEKKEYEKQLADVAREKYIELCPGIPKKQIENLKSLVEDLEAVNLEKTKKVYDLEDQLTAKEERHSETQQKLLILQEELSENEKTRQSELQSILQLLPHSVITEKPTFEDVKTQLDLFVKSTQRDYNKLMGVRESPDGSTQLNEVSSVNDTQFILENKNHIETEKEELLDFVSPFNRKTRNFNSQTEVDMLMMNKLCKKYDLLPVQIFNVTENIENGNFHKNDIVSQNNINKIGSVDNNDVINMIPIEELPIDISLADSELCTEGFDFIEQQINVVNESALNSILPAHNEFYDISFVKGQELNIEEASRKENNNSFDINQGNVEYQNKDLLIETVETRKPYPYEKEEVSAGFPERSEEHLQEISHNAEEYQLNTSYDSEELSSQISFNKQELNKETISLNSEEAESEAYPKSEKLDFITSVEASDIQIRDEIKKSNCQSLKPAQIIEFDRSDISSDSETDDKKTRRTSRRRNRGSPKVSRTEDRENVENIENSTEHSSEESNLGGTKRRRRRHGVSAEPVRVSWSEMRELYKKQQVQNIEERQDVIGNVTDVVQEEGIVVTVEDTETYCPPEIIHPIKDSGEDGTENIVSPENDNESSLSSTPSPYSSPPVSPEKSLQVPPQIICEGALGAMPLRWKNPMEENKELERNFNNAVFSFNTDQFTLQKRLENQERARDVAESGMDKELTKLKSLITSLATLDRGTTEFEEIHGSLRKQASILQKAAMKISAQSEQHGCYQQENRMAPNVEVMIKYAEYLRINIARLNEELHDLRRNYKGNLKTRSPESPQNKITDERSSQSEHEDNEDSQDIKKDDSTTEIHGRKKRLSFSAISKSLIAANGMSRLASRRRANVSRLKKRVSFGDIQYSNDDEIIDLTEPSRTQQSPVLKYIRDYWMQILGLILLLIFIYALTSFLSRGLEVDNFRLYDKLLEYIPHTVEYPAKTRE